jgi:hypothetical protein
VPWVQIFAVFVVSHAVGDYMLQTDWQARNKHGGLGRDPVKRRALISHIATYTLAFVPGLIWLISSLHGWVAGIAAVIAIPHLIQDDGRLLGRYAWVVKKVDLNANRTVALTLDQSFHLLALFLTALLAAS